VGQTGLFAELGLALVGEALDPWLYSISGLIIGYLYYLLILRVVADCHGVPAEKLDYNMIEAAVLGAKSLAIGCEM